LLNRDTLISGTFREHFAAANKDMLWTAEQLRESLLETLRTQPAPGELWVFAYGSLLWNPIVTFDARRAATLQGWHRSFCLRSMAGRGTAQAPGRMLALEPGGCTEGVALRIPAALAEDELRLMWSREMLMGSYLPTWLPVRFADGTQAHAITFLANATRPNYEKDASVDCIAPLIASACGVLGSNADYVLRLAEALAREGLRDEYVDALVHGIAQCRAASPAAIPGAAQTHLV